MAAELEVQGVEGEDYNLVERHGKTLVVPIRKSDDEPYHPEPQIRALQLVQEGKIGGPGRGQGRKRKPRAAEIVAEEVRNRLAPKIIKVLDRGLDSENDRTALQAADMALDIERKERALQLKEDQVDLENQTKEELIGALIQLAQDPHAETAIAGAIDLPPTAIEEVSSSDIQEATVVEDDRAGDFAPAARTSAPARPSWPHRRGARRNGRGAAQGDRQKAANPFTQAARGRSADG